MTSTSSGCLLEPATGFIGSLTTMASSNGLDCISASTSWSSRVYCLNALLDNTVFGSTIMAGCGGGHMTCLVAAHFAASFHIMPVVAFSAYHLANSSITSETHSEVRPVCMLSHWRTFVSSSVPSFHSGHAFGALNHIQPSLLFGSLYWVSNVIISWDVECIPEFDFKGMSHAFGCYFLVPQPEIYV